MIIIRAFLHSVNRKRLLLEEDDFNLYEGRYSPTNAQGKREVHTVYAKTKEECETLLEQMIAEVKAKIAAEKEQMKAVQNPPEP